MGKCLVEKHTDIFPISPIYYIMREDVNLKDPLQELNLDRRFIIYQYRSYTYYVLIEFKF